MGINKTGGIVRLAVGLAVVLWGAGLSHGVLIDNFSDGNDVGWRHTTSTPATWDVISEEYVLASDGAVENDTVGSAWQASLDDPQFFSNGFLRGKLRVNTTDTLAWLGMRAYRPVGGW